MPDRRSTRTLARAALGSAMLLLALSPLGCRQDMHDQAKYEAFERNAWFDDQRASRPILPGTVARGHLDADTPLYTGMGEDGMPVSNNPLRVDLDLLQRGRERYDIYCSPCHDRVGSGRGMIVQRGFPQPSTFHDPRLRNAADGYFFLTITNGFGTMPSYARQVEERDRWAIIAYIRALQRSQSASLDDVPAAQRSELESEE